MIAGKLTFSAFSHRNTCNIGDDIQSLAASRFAPISYWVDREEMWEFQDHPPSILLATGWMIHNPVLPPPPNLHPCYTSICIGSDAFWSGADMEDHLRRFSPIGCRDRKTLLELESRGIPCRYTGCLSLTLESPISRTGGIYFVDISEDSIAKFPEPFRSSGVRLTHDYRNSDRAARRRRVEELLEKYAAADLVVTSRLHCALPCLAFGTPVIMLSDLPDYRYQPYKKFCRVYLRDEVGEIDWDPIPPDISSEKHRIADMTREAISTAARRYRLSRKS